MKHEDFKLKLTGSYGYTFPSQAYNMDFQIISEGLKKNLWFKIGSGEGGRHRICLMFGEDYVFTTLLSTHNKHTF